MQSLFVFVIIIAVNILSKSVQDKKKIERARMKRTEELKNNPPPKPKVAERVNRAERSGRNLIEENFSSKEGVQRPRYDYSITEDRLKEKNSTKDSNYNNKYTDNKKNEEMQKKLRQS